jgi:RNase P/RNase MRP subunit p29
MQGIATLQQFSKKACLPRKRIFQYKITVEGMSGKEKSFSWILKIRGENLVMQPKRKLKG